MSTDVDLSRMAAGEQGYQRAYFALEAELDKLKVQLNDSLADWTTDARAAFDEAYAEWQRSMAAMAGQLAALHDVISIARRNYASARAANLTMWRGR